MTLASSSATLSTTKSSFSSSLLKMMACLSLSIVKLLFCSRPPDVDRQHRKDADPDIVSPAIPVIPGKQFTLLPKSADPAVLRLPFESDFYYVLRLGYILIFH